MANKQKLSTAEDENDRTKAAKEIIQKLKSSRELSDITEKTEKMSLALIEFAYINPVMDKTNNPKPEQTLSSNEALLKLKNMEQVLLPTHSLRISKSGNYLETPGFCGVSQFSARYSMVGGINAPKKISCIGSNGKVRPQLLKGKDDLRYGILLPKLF